MIDERERQGLAQSHQPERELGELHGRRVLIDAIQTLLRDEPARVEVCISVRFDDLRKLALSSPRGDDLARELPTRGHQERTRAHRGIADLQLQDLFGRALVAEASQQRLQRPLDDLLGQRARRVVTARAAPLFSRLEHEPAHWRAVVRGVCLVAGAERAKRDSDLVLRLGLSESFVHGGDLRSAQSASLFEEARPVCRRHGAHCAALHPYAELADANRRARHPQYVITH